MNLRSVYINKILEIISTIKNNLEHLIQENSIDDSDMIDVYMNLEEIIDIAQTENYSIDDSMIEQINSYFEYYARIQPEHINCNFLFIKTIINKIYNIISNDNFEEQLLDNGYSSIYYTRKFDKEELKNNNFYVNSQQTDLIFLACPSNRDEFEEFINNTQNDNEILFVEALIFLLNNIGFITENIDEKIICITNKVINSDEHKDKILLNYINLIHTSQGKVIHDTKKSNYQINLKINSNLNNTEKYIQFKDSIYIISEFNDKTGTLDKYIKLYQIIENFMYRYKICNLVNRENEMFSIREFKILYESVKETEIRVIKDFFKEMMCIDIDEYVSGKTLKHTVEQYIISFKNANTRPQIDNINKVLKKYKSLENINLNNSNHNDIITKIPIIVYELRNSILHNKETEKHLTNKNIPNEIFILLDALIIPVLVEIIFYLILNNNELISYRNNSIPLYVC